MATHTVEDGGTEAIFDEEHEPNFSFPLPLDETIDVKLVFETWENNDNSLDKLIGEAEVDVKDLIVSEDFLEHVLELHLPTDLELERSGSMKAIQVLKTGVHALPKDGGGSRRDSSGGSLRRASSSDVMHPARGFLVIDACERMAPRDDEKSDGDEDSVLGTPMRMRTPRSYRREEAIKLKEMEKEMKASAVKSAQAADAAREAEKTAIQGTDDGAARGAAGVGGDDSSEVKGSKRKLPTEILLRNLRAVELQFEKGDLEEAMDAVANIESHIQYEMEQDPYAPVPSDGAVSLENTQRATPYNLFWTDSSSCDRTLDSSTTRATTSSISTGLSPSSPAASSSIQS